MVTSASGMNASDDCVVEGGGGGGRRGGSLWEGQTEVRITYKI